MGSAESIANESALYGEQAVNKNQYLTFILAGEEYGVDILRVQEIKGWDSVTPIPNAPVYIKGVINIRGTIVPVIDLRLRFGLESLEYGPTTVMIVLKVYAGDKSRIMGIVVDAVSDVYDITSEQIRPAPDFGDVINMEYLRGLATVNDQMVIILDIDHMLNASDMRIAAGRAQTVNTDNNELNIDLLEQSFAELSQHGDLLVKRFYEELFKRYPDVKSLFNNTTIEEQQRKLLAAIKMVVTSIRDPKALNDVLVNLGERHRAYGAQPEHYQAVKATLLEVMKEISGSSWSEAKYSTWDHALQSVAASMLKAAGNQLSK
jgi:purine-binding chemotaxis protein CheW